MTFSSSQNKWLHFTSLPHSRCKNPFRGKEVIQNTGTTTTGAMSTPGRCSAENDQGIPLDVVSLRKPRQHSGIVPQESLELSAGRLRRHLQEEIEPQERKDKVGRPSSK